MNEKIKNTLMFIWSKLSKWGCDPAVFPIWNGPVYDYRYKIQEHNNIDNNIHKNINLKENGNY